MLNVYFKTPPPQDLVHSPVWTNPPAQFWGTPMTVVQLQIRKAAGDKGLHAGTSVLFAAKKQWVLHQLSVVF
jgi:hypothetical protein